MKRDWNLIREMLLAIEDQTEGGKILRRLDIPSSYPPAQVVGHLRLVNDAGFLEGNVKFHRDGVILVLHGLSWSGHDFLDTIWDNTVWEKTQEKAAQVGGSIALDTLKALAVKAAESLLGLS